MFSVLSALILLLIGSQLTGAILDYDADTMTSSLAPSPSSLLPSSICSTWANNSTLGPLVAIIVTPTNSGVILFRGRLSNADNLTVFQFPLSRLITNESAIQLKCKDGASLSSMALKDKWPTIYQSTPILQSAIQGITQLNRWGNYEKEALFIGKLRLNDAHVVVLSGAMLYLGEDKSDSLTLPVSSNSKDLKPIAAINFTYWNLHRQTIWIPGGVGASKDSSSSAFFYALQEPHSDDTVRVLGVFFFQDRNGRHGAQKDTSFVYHHALQLCQFNATHLTISQRTPNANSSICKPVDWNIQLGVILNGTVYLFGSGDSALIYVFADLVPATIQSNTTSVVQVYTYPKSQFLTVQLTPTSLANSSTTRDFKGRNKALTKGESNPLIIIVSVIVVFIALLSLVACFFCFGVPKTNSNARFKWTSSNRQRIREIKKKNQGKQRTKGKKTSGAPITSTGVGATGGAFKSSKSKGKSKSNSYSKSAKKSSKSSKKKLSPSGKKISLLGGKKTALSAAKKSAISGLTKITSKKSAIAQSAKKSTIASTFGGSTKKSAITDGKTSKKSAIVAMKTGKKSLGFSRGKSYRSSKISKLFKKAISQKKITPVPVTLASGAPSRNSSNATVGSIFEEIQQKYSKKVPGGGPTPNTTYKGKQFMSKKTKALQLKTSLKRSSKK